MSKGSMREHMPVTAAWIDSMRQAFGAKVVDEAMRRGTRGEQGFHATENGHEVGTPVYRGVALDRTPEPYIRRMGEVAWQAALDQQALENEKG
ncbi:MAG: hypothetical protein ACOH2S_01390 [Janthinobacterium svalbardensis]